AMQFPRPQDNGSSNPAPRITLGSLLKPNFGNSIRPIGESLRVFVQLIATLFAMNQLFPKDHPFLAPNTNVRLTLFQVIAIAWSNVSFKDEKEISRAMFFFAAVGCMAITTIVVIIGLFSLFVGSAHAQTSAFFTPAQDDLAQNWIDYLFKGTPLLND